MLLKKVVRHGNSRGVVLPRNLLHLIGVDPDTGVMELSVNDNTLIIKRAPMNQDELAEEERKDKEFFGKDIFKGLKL